MEEPNVQKRKRYEDPGLDSTADEKRIRQARTHANRHHETQQYWPDYDVSYQPAPIASRECVSSSTYYAYSPFDQQTARPPAASTYTTTGPISLPGAALYRQQQFGHAPLPLPIPVGAAEAARARERVFTALTAAPISSETHRHQAIASLPERHVLRRPYPDIRDQLVGSSVVPTGSQHDPFEIESSPEVAQAIRPSKQRKKKFYAVIVGRVPGIYDDWDEVERQTTRFKGAKQQGFPTWEEAEAFFEVNMRTTTLQYDYRGDAIKRHELPAAAQQVQKHPTDFEYGPPPYTEKAAAPARVAITPAEPEPVLKAEQQKVVDLILQGHNVFYTGSAGCGKSTILKAFVKQLQLRGKRVKIVAPTNLAALNVGGVTTWSYAGWTPDSMKKPLDKLMQAAHGKEIWERFDTTDVLVIDEISMVENLLFERLNYVMKASRGERYGGGPFGGVQVIVTGDFCQLSPVKPFQYCIGCGWEFERDHPRNPKEYRCENKYCREDIFHDIDKWAFRSKAWEECAFKHINLTEIHRQSDKKFISILQKIRTGMLASIVQHHALADFRQMV
jgi:energy-coupling factor transporter ATP-binding protein EcfA2